MRSRAAISSEQLAVGLLFVCISGLAAMVKAQSDTFWQLRSGEEIWQHRAVSFVDTFSYTAHGLYWPNHEWLTEVLFHVVHSTGGMPALGTLCAAAIITACVLSWRLTTGRFEVRLGLFVLSLTAVVGAWSMRPQVVTMACFMVTCTLLAKDRLWVLPAFFALWANLHAGVAIGLISVGAVVVADTVIERRIQWRQVTVAVLCFAATAATPMGVGLWRLLASYSQRTKIRGISEWMAPGLPPEYLGFWIIAAAFIVALGTRWRLLEVPGRRLAAIALLTLPLALSAHRNVVMFLLVAVPALSHLSAAGKPQPSPAPARDYKVANGVLLGVSAAVVFAFILLSWRRPPERLNWTPLEPAAIVAIRECPSPVYNALSLGGEIIGFVREQPVFIDNRNDPYPTALLHANLRLEQSGDYGPLFDEYAIKCAIVETGSLTAQRLRTDAAWRVGYSDAHLEVFLRR